MVKAGFVDVVERRFKVPIGGWPADPRLQQLGLYNRLQWAEGIEGWSMYLLTNVLGVSRSIGGGDHRRMADKQLCQQWTREEVDVYLAKMRKGLQDPTIHAYQEW
jgi:hypothetical protein